MKTIYFHVGPHKTGTTFLQKVCEENKGILRASGIDYLEFGKLYFGHHEMASSLSQAKYKKGDIQRAIEQSACKKILLSSENFDVLDSRALSYLSEELKPYEVRVLVFFRTPTIRLYSWWQEEVKHGNTKSYSEYVSPHYSKPFASEVLNINNMLHRYVDKFGSESISIFDYEACLAESGTLDPFLELLGVSVKPTVAMNRVNDGLSILHVETIRALNIIARAKGELKFHNVRDAYLRRWNKNDPLMKKIRDIQEGHSIAVSYGDSYVDKMLKKATIQTYKNNFVTNISNDYKEKIIVVPEASWVADKMAQKSLQTIYKSIM
ncbi:hypothetical protein [Microbulbifer sp. TRSA007]|uniref:hypothetical protein n=1 Tax=Microbulbifer sp. TRSA007 TaxID=3243384 RepID=UPI00403A5787